MIPNMLAEVQRCKNANPVAWQHAHTGDSQTEDFIRLLAADLHAIDSHFGLNGKRGDPNDISDDAINWLGEGPGHDPTHGGAPVTVIDVIASAGSPSAAPSWQVINLPGPGAWVLPGDAPVPVPVPPPAPVYPPYPGDATFDALGVVLFADYAQAGQPPNPQMGRWFGRTMYDWLVKNEPTLDASIAKHRAEWRALLGLPPL